MEKIEAVNTFWSNPITLIAAGAIIGFITSTAKDFINYYTQSKKAKNDLALKRLDEVFVLLSKNADTIRKLLPNLLSNAPSKENFDDTSARLSFTIRVYFPTILPQYQKYIQEAVGFAGHQSALALTTTIQDIKKTTITKEYANKHIAFEKLYGELCTLIVDKAKEYK